MIPCSWKENFGIECPSCGVQRSFLELMHGHILESLIRFPALLPLIAVVILTIVHLIKPFPRAPYWIVRLFILSASLMFLNWIVRLIF